MKRKEIAWEKMQICVGQEAAAQRQEQSSRIRRLEQQNQPMVFTTLAAFW